MEMNREFWHKKRVFLTGHTGFKGSWLSLWMADMGAEVHGFALEPDTEVNLYTSIELNKFIERSTLCDIRDLDAVTLAMNIARPEIVIHMAAQPLVRNSYADPVKTYEVNVMGTINLLEAIRKTKSVKAVVNVTTDKCYDNCDWVWPYRENDKLGGYDPYSNSKACSELVTSAYRSSFMDSAGVHIASARAGNVIGGGDWSADRIVPDFLRAINEGRILTIRSPKAVRPWQHVLEPLSGYLTLAEKLMIEGKEFAEPWNFGPEDKDAKSVQWLLNYLSKKVETATWKLDDTQQPHEAKTLKLDSTKAKSKLDWEPRWNIEKALDMTLEWHSAWKKNSDMKNFSLRQIREYETAN